MVSWGAKRRIVGAALVGALLMAGTAEASVTAWNEPSYTKTSANNAYWFNWQAVTGTDENSNTRYEYYLCFFTYDNGTTVESSNGTNGPGTQNCTGSLRSGPTPSSGNYGVQPFTSGTVLTNGHQYQMCASDYWRWPYTWHWGGASSCGTTVIDRTAPAGTITLAGGAAYTKASSLPIHITYVDAISPPWPGPSGQSWTYGCLARGGQCAQPPSTANGWSWHQGCSNPAAASTSTYMDCAWDLSAQPDGAYYYCAIQADSAVPDNPSGTNQFASATSDQANLSPVACDSTVLDRAAPTVTASASNTNVNTGNLVTFTAGASDAASGVSGAYAWTFGDNTAQGSGANTSHTYTQPGTYVAKVTTADGAGNSGEASVTITVTTAPGGGGDPGGGTSTTPTTTTTTSTSTTPTTTTTTTSTTPTTTTTSTTPSGSNTNGSSTDGTSTNTTSGVTQTTSSSIKQEIQQSSGQTQSQKLGSVLGVLAPKALRIKGARPFLLLGLTPARPGRVLLQLLRKNKVVASKAANLGRRGVFALRMALARKLAPGAYRLRITFRPAAGGKFTKTLKLTIRGARGRVHTRVLRVAGGRRAAPYSRAAARRAAPDAGLAPAGP